MTKLDTNELDRWASAKLWIFNFKMAAIDNNAVIFYGDERITHDQLVIEHLIIYVTVDNCRFVLYEADPDLAHGLEETTQETLKRFRSELKLYKEIFV